MQIIPSGRLIAALVLGGVAVLALGSNSRAAELTQKVHAMEAMPGFFPLYWEAGSGKLWLEISRFDSDFLYVDSLPAGLGSNDVGLDRGQLGRERVVRFQRIGPRVLLVERNLAFRADGGSAEEAKAVEDSFASSVIAGFDVAAEEDGRVLVDGTDFFFRDAHNVIGALKEAGQGSFVLDPKRSAFYLPRVKSFPKNTEIEVTLTFSGGDPGKFVREVTPDPHSITIRERHSLVQLPDAGYRPRVFDPRAGYFSIGYADYSAPIGDPIQKRFILRHRLVKKDPSAARSEAVEPLVYYLDPGTPEPIRSALLDGARWWDQAFEAAGFIHAFRVEMLPAGADMMDVRYNTIEWVHRATRGWSYGTAVADPRTGEIIKGHVLLGSLRVRQDFMIAEGLLAPYENGAQPPPELERMVLARLRQLAAHELGHTLGLAHNYIGSAQGRSSVMDYPFPLIEERPDHSLDLSHAYATGIGEWDKVAIECGYGVFAAGTDEAAAMSGILHAARDRGLIFLTDQDARPIGSVHPQVHLWDNGSDAVTELTRVLSVRASALSRFGENVIRPGRPLATIEEALVPIYLLHRYQIEAASKSIGGESYAYALRGDGQAPLKAVPAADQRRALEAVLGALAPSVLRLPAPLLDLLPPRPSGFQATRELFTRRTGLAFDALAPAEAAAELTFGLLLNRERAARLVQQHARDPQLPGLEEVIGRILELTWYRAESEDLDGEIERSVDSVALAHVLALAASRDAAPQVRAIAEDQLHALQERLVGTGHFTAPSVKAAHNAFGAHLIELYFANPKDFTPPPTPEPPPGQPIGDCADDEWDDPIP